MRYIGTNIRFIREARNITQTELSEKVGISQTAVSNIEKGLKDPTMKLAIRIARVLGCSLDLMADGVYEDDYNEKPPAGLSGAADSGMKSFLQPGA